MNDRRLCELWLTALLSDDGAALGTIDTYQDDLDVYLGWLSSQGLTLLAVTHANVVDFLRFLDERGYSPASISKKRSVVRTLHRFIVAEGYGESDPTTLMEPGKRGRRLPHIISMKDVEKLLATAHARASDDSLSLFAQASYARRAALLETLYASGMRVSEAVTLPRKALRDNSRMLFVKGKGNKERLVPMHNQAVIAIQRWLAAAKAYGVTSEKWIFHSVRDGSKALTRQSSLAEIKQAALDAGLSQPNLISPHKLRHAFATHLLANGADLRVIQELLGHADLGSTEIYTHVEMSRSQRMLFDLHPLSTDDAAT
ncbi:tyrosine recombinase [Bosea sp. RAC05]|uniref:tyrosine recombinase n=1 Tax=Bosea sp. RAC05 TaxID=1842539 RepID=UPI00083E4648|nr:tyrosine recombinase [Bosea sp. RAC05]AOG02954.1 phage integrase family protein [Bosea sp. RAC05]